MALQQGSLFGDFKNFIMRGNVLDLAVAVILGGAFSKIVESFIKDIITPVVLAPVLDAARLKDIAELSAGGVKYGLFLSAVINFLLVSFVIFLVVRSFETAKRKLSRQEVMAEVAADPVLAQQQLLIDSIDRLNNTFSRKI
ncbi:MAG: large conductance mechanosensitive channel protein MscL [Chamaesiphon sp.]|nr:large conductance mechanosensitive channel protein MscL [Chamaesiphon sp.]